MKIDIEGMEEAVFREFFTNAPPTVWPRFICAEMLHSGAIRELLAANGYKEILRARENAIFERA